MSSESAGESAGVLVTLNGARLYVRRLVLPYRDILALAGYGPQAASAGPAVTVTYPKGSGRVDRVVEPGAYADVVAGMALKVGRV